MGNKICRYLFLLIYKLLKEVIEYFKKDDIENWFYCFCYNKLLNFIYF